MKDVSELKFPPELAYVDSHEWVRAEGGRARIGITDYAQDQLGDVVYVEVPAVGKSFEKGAPFGSVESVKAVSELYMPIGGRVAEINPALCKGCGLCVASCRSGAIRLRGFDDAQIYAMIDNI